MAGTRKACCLFCHREFKVNGRQLWHSCKKARLVKNQEESKRHSEYYLKHKERIRAYNNENRKKNNPSAQLDKTGWKKCSICGTPTPNRTWQTDEGPVQRCDGCLNRIGTNWDVQTMQFFTMGHKAHNGFLVRV